MLNPSRIYEILLSSALERSHGKTISDLRIGLGYIATKLSDGSCGLSYVFRNEISPGCSVLKRAGYLDGESAESMAKLFLSGDLLESSLGLSVINALSEPVEHEEPGDILEHLSLKGEDIVTMVGFFGPLIPEIRKKAGEFYVFDMEKRAPFVKDPKESEKAIRRSTIVIVTATSLINKTFDRIVEKAKNARELCVLGPSTPLYPEVFAAFGVTLIAGVRVLDPDRILKVVSQGGGTRNFGDAVKKVTMRVK